MKKNEHMSKLFISSLKNNTYIIYFQSIKCCLLQTTGFFKGFLEFTEL